MAINYAPIVDNEVVPAFYDKGLYIYFKHNPAVDPNEVTGFRAIIKDFITGNIVHITSRTEFDKEEDILLAINNGEIFMGNADIDDVYSSKLIPGNFYKFQLCYLYNNNTKESPYSYVTIGRYLGSGLKEEENGDKIDNKISVNVTQKGPIFTGSELNNNNLGERIYQYCFEIIDNTNTIIDSTGWQLYTNKVPEFISYYNFNQTIKYSIRYSIKTHNGYKTFVLKECDDIETTLSFIEIIATQDTSSSLENGYVDIKINNSEDPMQNYQVLRKAENSDFWEKIYNFGSKETLSTINLKDNTIEQGLTYRYTVLSPWGFINPANTSSLITPDFEHIFLSDKNCQLCIRFDPKISNFKTTLLEQKIDTLGGKYPILLQNGQVGYKEIGISGLISYHMDNDNFFFSKEEWINNYDDYGTTNQTKQNFYLERQFRDKVVKWLTNGEPKLFRSPTEGNMVVRLMNVSITPNEQLGRMIYNFSATGYEVEDIKGKVDKYVIEQ